MCGIVGMVNLRTGIDAGELQRRRDLISYRGPDDSGHWLSGDGQVGLAHRRLSIVDLSDHGHQPMHADGSKLCMIFNGEVYNYEELREELVKLGHCFHGHGDSEVVLAAYAEWGESCLERFNGMFALAIYDARSHPATIFLARDRAGKKPLYYSHSDETFDFGSELKTLASTDRLNLTALNYYLSLGYIPASLSLAEGVHKLPPAHAARLDLSTMNLQVWRYWQLPENEPLEASGEELADAAEELLMDAVSLRLHCDVPSGVLLSGGLDSGLVAAVSAKVSLKPVPTFTISLPNSSLNEAPLAQQVADYYGTDHHVLEMGEPSLAIVHEFAHLIDEPIADSSLIPSWVVARLTRQHVTVALGGDGGDELFGGYSDYPVSLSDQQGLGWIPASFFRFVGETVMRLPAGIRGRNRIASLRHGPLQQLVWGRPYFDVGLRKRILKTDALVTLDDQIDAPERWLLSLFMQGNDPVDCMTRTHFGSILPDDFMVKVDRASMFNSLEMRAPFLDHRLVEFAFGSVPSKWKVEGGESRRIQRILAKRLLPPSFNSSRKQGFSIPLDNWLRSDGCSIIRDYMAYLPDQIDKAEVERLIAGQMKGRANGSRLYALLMLAISSKNNGWCK